MIDTPFTFAFGLGRPRQYDFGNSTRLTSGIVAG